jgi:hypothetical protein
MKKDPISKMLDEAYEEFEKKEPHVPKIMGYEYPEYVALMMFVDAFADAAIKDSPTVAEKFQVPGRDLLENVMDYFDKIGLDIFDYADPKMGMDLIDRVNELWGDNFSIDALMQYDKDALGTIVLIALGHDIRLDSDTRLLLKNHDAKEPTAANLGVDHDERRYKAAYDALEEIQGMKTESRDDLSESLLDLFGIGDKEKKKEKGKADTKALKLIESILKQLKIKYHLDKEKGDEGTVFRHHLTIAKKHYILKSYIIEESQHLSSVLWDEHEDNFLVVVLLGYLKDYYALLAFGRQRLKSWMESEHGSTRSE